MQENSSLLLCSRQTQSHRIHNADGGGSWEFRRRVSAGDTVIKVKFWNKNQALELMHKHLRLLEERDPNAGQPDVPAFIISSKVSIT